MSIETHTFIVRLWQEDGDSPDRSVWRGSLETVPEGQRAYFRSLDELVARLSERSGFPDTGPGE